MPKATKAVLVGNYGVANIGDEALKEYFLKHFPDVEWTVVSHSRETLSRSVPRLPYSAGAFFSFRWLSTLGAIIRSDVVVFGGGTLFTDIEYWYACPMWGAYALLARFFRKPYFYTFQGVGPFRTAHGRWWGTYMLKHAALVTVRDAQSRDRGQALVPGKDIIQSFDPAILLFSELDPHAKPRDVLTVIPRSNTTDIFFEKSKKTAADHAYAEIRILSFQFGRFPESDICTHLQDILPGTPAIVSIETVEQLLREISGTSFMLTQRFHGAIAAVALGVPFETVPLAKNDKLDAAQSFPAKDELLSLAKAGEDALHAAFASLIRK